MASPVIPEVGALVNYNPKKGDVVRVINTYNDDGVNLVAGVHAVGDPGPRPLAGREGLWVAVALIASWTHRHGQYCQVEPATPDEEAAWRLSDG